jgi:hypothetical protein
MGASSAVGMYTREESTVFLLSAVLECMPLLSAVPDCVPLAATSRHLCLALCGGCLLLQTLCCDCTAAARTYSRRDGRRGA